MVTWAGVVTYGTSLPGVEESTSYGTVALKVRGKLLVRLREDGTTIVVGTTFADREHLLRDEPGALFLTDHYRDYEWILVRMARAKVALLRSLIEDAWRRAAPAKLVREYDAARGAKA
jgi:hypothetical protein